MVCGIVINANETVLPCAVVLKDRLVTYRKTEIKRTLKQTPRYSTRLSSFVSDNTLVKRVKMKQITKEQSEYLYGFRYNKKQVLKNGQVGYCKETKTLIVCCINCGEYTRFSVDIK